MRSLGIWNLRQAFSYLFDTNRKVTEYAPRVFINDVIIFLVRHLLSDHHLNRMALSLGT